MSEKDNFSDLVGNRSGQSASSDYTSKNLETDELDSLDSLDFFDSSDFSDAPNFSHDDSDAVDELIDVTEVSVESYSTPQPPLITGPDDELEFVASEETIPHADSAGHTEHTKHTEPTEHTEPTDSPDIAKSAPHPPRYSHRATDSVLHPGDTSTHPSDISSHPDNTRPRRATHAIPISDIRPVSKNTISTSTIRSSGKKSKPRLASNIISVSTYDDADTPEQTEPYQSQPTSHPRSTKSKNSRPRKSSHLVVGLLCVITALIVAVAGIAIAIKLINDNKKPQPSQGNTDTPEIPVVTDDRTTLSFLQLENNSKNLVYSPLSIRSGLALLNAGADGATKTQISKVLGSAEIPQYQDVDNELSLANGIFIRGSYRGSVLDSYINSVTDNQNAQLIFGDLTSDLINKWAKDETLGLIDNLGVQPTPETEIILANALAIKMDWRYQFRPDLTHGDDFYISASKKINAATMSRVFTTEEDVYYAKDANATIVSLPLSSKSTAELEFAAIMPSSDLSTYIDNLTPVSLQEKLSHLASASSATNGIKVNIPKFKFDYALDFKKDLESLGITNAFNLGTANFSKLSTSRLAVNDAVHKANIDFSEDGIKAAAVTSFSLGNGFVSPSDDSPIELSFDHPFIFVIRDRANGTVWFTGAVYTPTSE